MVIGPFADGKVNVSRTCKCFTKAITNLYASLFLALPGGVTPHYYFNTILPVIEADGMATTCEPLTHFSQVAIASAGPNVTSLLQVDAAVAPWRHGPLLAQADAILTHHLPL